jgi:hypothetical protein
LTDFEESAFHKRFSRPLLGEIGSTPLLNANGKVRAVSPAGYIHVPNQEPVKSIPLRSRFAFAVYLAVFGIPAVIVAIVALVRAPKSLVLLALLILSGLAVIWHVRVWRCNLGEIEVTDDELIVRPRRGPILRRNLKDIRSIQRAGIYTRTKYAQYSATYVRIFTDDHAPIQFRWNVGITPKAKDQNPCQLLISSVKRRLPGVEVAESTTRPETLTVEHGRRDDQSFGAV